MTYWFLQKKERERMAQRFDDQKAAVNYAIAAWERMTDAERDAAGDMCADDALSFCVIFAPPDRDAPWRP